MDKKWYQKAYRRCVIDMHITDCDKSFMSEFDAKNYVDMLLLSQAQSVVVYAHSHYGLCYFPTKVSTMHPGLNGRNILDEVIDLCHKNNIYVVIYCSAIYDTIAYRKNPDWKIKDVNGNPVAENSRYGICCPNSPYRNYLAELAEEICSNFEFEGIRFDMTFWPTVCYCHYCQERFADEVNEKLPKSIDWRNSLWVIFQRKREEWLVDFAKFITDTVKRVKPGVSVEHQSSTYHTSWNLGVTYKLAQQSDFLQGDFYGDALQGTFARKLFYNLSESLPCGFETCISVDLGNYTTLKSKELLKAKACASLADGAAFVFIDSIDPIGTLNKTVYQRMGEIFSETKVYEPYLGGDLCQDIAVYFSTESKFDFNGSGTPHVDSAVSVCKSLINNHLPFGVITKRNINNLSQYKIIVLPNILMIDKEEAEAFREYVRSGGNVYASRGTSLITKDGKKHDNFLLSDVFGVSYKGETRENFTYIAPVKGMENIFAEYTTEHPIGFYASQLIVEAKPGAKVLGKTLLPYFMPGDPIYFASIHNNPPGVFTNNPAITLNHFGAGKVIYATVELEKFDPSHDLFVNLIKLLSDKFTFEAEAPKAIEITVFHQGDKNRFLISLINFQHELPNIPVENIKIKVRLDDSKFPKSLKILPGEKDLSYEFENGYVLFETPKFETLCMLALYYK
ncbi:MAG: beta-galactosidase trimerization domain-containing protein [bacterium]